MENTMEKDFKNELVKLLEEVTNAGLEGAIPRLIAEAVNEANFIYNTNEVTLYWVAVHCNHLYNN